VIFLDYWVHVGVVEPVRVPSPAGVGVAPGLREHGHHVVVKRRARGAFCGKRNRRRKTADENKNGSAVHDGQAAEESQPPQWQAGLLIVTLLFGRGDV
jgi:hypothetical protein